jgi:hypothetical protein
MENIDKLKRSEIDRNLELKNIIFLFLQDNNIELNWVSNYKQIIYHYVNGMMEIPKCYCGKLNNFKSAVVGYRKTCSPECSNQSITKKEKIINTKLERYGDKNYNNSSKVKKTKLVKYGDENYNNREKAFKTNEVKYGSYSPMKNEDVIKLGKLTKLINHGNENYNNIEKIKRFWNEVEQTYIDNVVSKTKNTKLINHDDENYNNPEKMIKTKIEKYGFYFTNHEKAYDTKVKNGIIKTGDILKDWQFYRREVARFTRKNKKHLYENWNGHDYYDNELIKGYLSHTHTHRFYPTIDHKISVYFGFMNNISPEEIGSLDNLCITKRYINSMKGKSIENNFNI